MLHLWVIALFAGIALRDTLKEPLLHDWLSPSQAAWVTLGAMMIVGVGMHVTIAAAAARLRSRGSWRAVLVAEAALASSRWLAVVIHLAATLAFGWLDSVRRLIGDVVALDEIVAMTPAIAVFAWGWWAIWPMERSLRQATIVRQLDEGGTIYPIPGRRRFAFLNLRQHVLVWLTPLLLILAWSESVVHLTRLLARHGGETFAFLRDAEIRASVNIGLDLFGALFVFLVLGPLSMRVVWDTVRLAPGRMRDELLALCKRHKVRVSDILVWRTQGTMINGAVLGFIPAFRYVFLTDALLDSLPDEQVEAVMAHEVAHVRHRHMIWLALVLLVSIIAIGWLAELAADALGLLEPDGTPPPALALGVAAGSLALSLVLLGVVSRRFEWQADAFAAAHMSERLAMLPSPDQPEAGVVTEDGARAMAGALRAVATLNHMPLDRPSWRHGSIRLRIERLRKLVGVPAARAPIHATARALKLGVLLVIVIMVGIGAVQFISGA